MSNHESSALQISQQSFVFCLIPEDEKLPIQELVGDGSGGLENDKLTAYCRTTFSHTASLPSSLDEQKALCNSLRAQAIAAGTPAQQLAAVSDEQLLAYATSDTNTCEITALTLPVAASNFHGVSCYSDRNADAKRLGINARATAIARGCGHTSAEIKGNAYLSRYIDNEAADIWKRVDFKLSEAAPTSDWCRRARKKGGGGGAGGSGSSLSGLVGKMQAPNGQPSSSSSSASPSSSSPSAAASSSTLDINSYSWTQDDSDVEIVIKVDPATEKKHVQVAFARTHLRVVVKGFVVIDARTGGDVETDACTWTLQTSGSQRELCVTLPKEGGGRWVALLE
jgi:hypothetical protein